jgi:hypothetical protein
LRIQTVRDTGREGALASAARSVDSDDPTLHQRWRGRGSRAPHDARRGVAFRALRLLGAHVYTISRERVRDATTRWQHRLAALEAKRSQRGILGSAR